MSSALVSSYGTLTNGHFPDRQNGKTHWINTAFIIVASMLGTGVLSVPFAIAQLGGIWGYISLFILGIGCIYSGLLCAQLLAVVPTAIVMADIGEAALGRKGRNVVMSVSYIYITGVSIILQLTATLALQDTFFDLMWCKFTLGILVSIVSIPLLQYRSLQEVSWIALVGIVGILIPCAIVVVELTNGHISRTQELEDTPSPPSSTVGFLNLIYAYAGQAIFIELMAEMKQPTDFPKSAISATCVMYATYLAVGYAGYRYVGPSVQSPITSELAHSMCSRLTNFLLFCHIIVAYIIEVNILATAMVHYLLPSAQKNEPRHLWFFVTTGIVLFCLFVSNIIPFLGELIGLFGAIGSVTTTYIFPCLLTLLLRRGQLSRMEHFVCIFLIVAGCGIAVLGVFSSLASIYSKWSTHGSAFVC